MYTTKTLNSKEHDVSYLDFIQKYATIGIWEYNTQTSELYWSDETKHIHQVSKDFQPKVETAILFYKEGFSRETITVLFENCIKKHEDFDIDLQVVTAKGNEKWVRAIGKAIVEDNKCVKIQGLFQDIDRKTKDAIALSQKETQLRKSFKYALVGMGLVSLEGNWINVNDSLCKTLGYTKTELKELNFLDITYHEDKNVGSQSIKAMINGDIDSFELEKRYLRKDGTIIWAKLSASVIRDDFGKALHFIVQINDLSEVKKSNKKVIQLLETTENQNERLLNFAHIVSHNLRSHYSNLGMLLDFFKLDIPEATNNELFPLIEDAVKHLGETVVNLNEVAAINTTKKIATEPINLLETFKKVSNSISALIIDSNTVICVDIDKDIHVNGIPAYLDSILLNFLTNAIKYKRDDKPAKIELKTKIEGEFIILAIKDNGKGIDLNMHGKKLFGMYKTFHDHEDSRGLGLFITKNQVEALGGKIEVESKVNEGTIFYVYLLNDEKN